MRGKNFNTGSRWLVGFMALALWLVSIPNTASGAETTAVSISAPSGSLEAGEQLSITIEVEPGTPIAGMQFDLSFDPALFAVSTVQEGDLLNRGEATSFFNPGSIDNQAGKVTGVFGAITSPGVTASTPGSFATVILTARQRSEGCPLSLSNVIVGDIEGNAVPVSLEGESSPSATPSATVEKPVFHWWVLSVIVGVAVVLIGVTVAAILLRRRQMLRALDASRSPSQRTAASVK